MRNIFLILAACFPLLAHATAYTSTQNGPWSATATWGGSGPPGIGDTATIAHTVNVDANTTVGTSPNDNTTAVITINSSKTLVITNGFTLTIRGNLAIATSTLTLNAGAGIVFDNSASGGSPVYKLTGASVPTLNCNGTSGSHCSLSCISGQTWILGQSWTALTATYTDFTRMASQSVTGFSTGANVFTHCTWTSCAEIGFVGGAGSLTLTDNIFTNSVAASSFNLNYNSAGTTRILTRNIADGLMTYQAGTFTVTSNCLGNGIICVAGATFASCRNNLLGINGANGSLFTDSIERNYFTTSGTGGNPHWVQPNAKIHDSSFNQNIFDSNQPDVVDGGDVFLCMTSSTSGGFQVIGNNNIVLPSSATNTSGTLVTLYDAGSTFLSQWNRNTCNANMTTTAAGRLGVVDLAEANTGFAGQISVWKSNVGWGSSASQNYLVQRQTGNVKDIMTAVGADYNWTYNLSVGDNFRGYDDRAANNTLWTAGDAIATGVDVHQGTGNPQFYDSARNLPKWCFDRGYGTQTYTNALTVIQNDLTKIPDLINYVFEGFRPQNLAMRNAANDGGCVGAANFARDRNLASVNRFRATLSIFGL